MKAMVLEKIGGPLKRIEMEDPEAGPGQLKLEVGACGVCRTDLHLVDGELSDPPLPIVPGHEIVGRVVATGEGVKGFAVGDRVGVPWLGRTCNHCRYCRSGQENLCDTPGFTGYQINGGYAERTVAQADYCFRIPGHYSDRDAAPLLCAGLIGYRSLKLAGDNLRHLGIYGFGAAAHIVAQIAIYREIEVHAFTSPGDVEAQAFARAMGAATAGDSDMQSPVELDAAIIFAPVGSLVPAALKATRKGGTVVCGGIHMSEIPAFPYEILWGERILRSVANLTRQDGEEFLRLAAEIPVRTMTQPFALDDANEALNQLRAGQLTGAAVLIP